MDLNTLGWNTFFEEHFERYRDDDVSALRVARENRGKYIVLGECGELAGELSGRYRFETDSKAQLPAVGDWVVGTVHPGENKATIQALLPRKTAFSRHVAGQVTDEQIVAANIDTLFIVTGLDLNFNIRRIERYCTMAWNSGALPVILLNKADCCDDPAARKAAVELIAPGIDVYTLSAGRQTGLEPVRHYLQPGKTVAFIGSSGVGKSTIINALIGTERFAVNEVSDEGSRGRHTTTFRELIVLAAGGIVIDTPGMRELQVWGDEDALKQVFEDIEELAANCRFSDCRHENEPGCAIREAAANGTLDAGRLESYYKLRREFAYLADRQTMKASAVEKARSKSISKQIKIYYRDYKDK